MATKNVLVRVLQAVRIHASDYSCNNVVSMPVKLADAHEKAGNVDSDPDAVAYARDVLGSKPIEHVVPEGMAVVPADPQSSDAGDGGSSVSAKGATNGPAGTQAEGAGAAQQTDLLKPQQ
jgi:hypothetical protein